MSDRGLIATAPAILFPDPVPPDVAHFVHADEDDAPATVTGRPLSEARKTLSAEETAKAKELFPELFK